jgi:transcriptional regulator with XRE-family HTH domain
MMINPLAISIRSKKLGVLIRDSRLSHNKTVGECAMAIGVSPETFEDYELGEQSPSLPQAELLAYFLNMPFEHFWGATALSEGEDAPNKIDPNQLVRLRQRMIGVQIRQTRMGANLTVENIADRAGISADKLEAYEMGEKPIPLPELEALVVSLNLSIRDFQDRHSQIGQWFIQQRAIKDFMDLPPEVQAFVCKPVNRPYLELAQRLSEMSVDRLRTVAEVLLEITL